MEYGAWERAISLFRTQYAYIAVARKGQPGVLHFAIGECAIIYRRLYPGMSRCSTRQCICAHRGEAEPYCGML